MGGKQRMNIYQALKQVKDWRKAEYFKWIYDIRYDRRLPKKTEDEFLHFVGRETLNPYIEWEKSEEYLNLVNIYLHSKTANDLVDIYEAVADKAKTGDKGAIEMFLRLSKEISSTTKQAKKKMNVEEDEDTGLELT